MSYKKQVQLLNDAKELKQIKRSKSIPSRPIGKRKSIAQQQAAYDYILEYPYLDQDMTDHFFSTTMDMPCCIQRLGHEDEEIGFPPRPSPTIPPPPQWIATTSLTMPNYSLDAPSRATECPF